jgi:hypothetical protein
LSVIVCVIWLAGTVVNVLNAQESAEPLRPGAQPSEELRAIRQLSVQIEDLSNKLAETQTLSRTLVSMEVLTRAEHRAEDLRAQLLDVQIREIRAQARIEELDYQLKPESLRRALAFVGGVRLDEMRDDLRATG